MDYLKSRAPFWKKQHGPDGPRWVEPTARDLDDLARWEPALRALFHGRPIYDADTVDLPPDLRRAAVEHLIRVDHERPRRLDEVLREAARPDKPEEMGVDG